MIVIAIILGYLIGAIPIGYIFGKIKGIDVREVGFKRIGASNIHRTFGFLPAVCVFFGDFMKPILALLLGRAITGSELVAGVAGIFAIIGHNWPIYLKFKGEGRGLASSLGLLYFLIPIETMISFSFLLCLGIALKMRSTAFSTFILFCIIPWITFLFNEPIWLFWLCLGISLLALIARVLGGIKEIKISEDKGRMFFNLLLFDSPERQGFRR